MQELSEEPGRELPTNTKKMNATVHLCKYPRLRSRQSSFMIFLILVTTDESQLALSLTFPRYAGSVTSFQLSDNRLSCFSRGRNPFYVDTLVVPADDAVSTESLELQVGGPNQHLHLKVRSKVLGSDVVPMPVLPLHILRQLRFHFAHKLRSEFVQTGGQLVGGKGRHDKFGTAR